MKRTITGMNLSVNAIGLGAMPLSLDRRPDEAQAMEVIRAFVDGGGDFIDTANVYCIDNDDIGHNERLIAGALAKLGRREKVTVATKGGLTRPRGDWETDGRPVFIRASCERSLRDLHTDGIALYQLHAFDPKVPMEDTVGELVRLQTEGKIRHIGLSNVRAAQLEAALGMARIVSVQNRCNVLEQKDFRNGLVALCGRLGVTYIPHSPVGGYFGHRQLGAHALLQKLAVAHDCSPQVIALAWLLARGDHILPIPGASRPASIRDSLTATHLTLTEEEMRSLDAMSG
ncbi:MAG TPA: aldo/keto reductase [Gammaproteobacteria bacterium]|nr:aldo/keto reductase [Gammaproteobacteria bacterium]